MAAGLGRLLTGGIEEVAVESLARQLGVTKGSFYWHFAGRSDLLGSILDKWERESTDVIIESVEGSSDDPVARLAKLWDLSSNDAVAPGELEVRLREWAARDPEVAAKLREVDARRLDYVARLLVEAGLSEPTARVRAEAMYKLLIGHFFWQVAGGAGGDGDLAREIVAIVTSPERR